MSAPTISTTPDTPSQAQSPTFWLDELNHSLPRRLFGTEAARDVQELGTLARVLLCWPQNGSVSLLSVLPASQSNRLQRALAVLLDNTLLLDMLVTNPELMHPALPLLHLRHRAAWPASPSSFIPIKRALDARYVEENEWTSMHLLDLTVHLHALGLPCPVTPEEAAERSVLPLSVPTWQWCYEKMIVLNSVLRAAANGGLPIPEAWRAATHAHLLAALHGEDLRVLSERALAHALTPRPDVHLLQAALQRSKGLADMPTADRWMKPVAAAQLSVTAALMPSTSNFKEIHNETDFI